MYLDRPANRLQSPSGFLSSEQVPPLSLLHVGASTPGFYAKSRCFIFFKTFNFTRLSVVESEFSEFYLLFFFFLYRFNVSIIVESIFDGRQFSL